MALGTCHAALVATLKMAWTQSSAVESRSCPSYTTRDHHDLCIDMATLLKEEAVRMRKPFGRRKLQAIGYHCFALLLSQ